MAGKNSVEVPSELVDETVKKLAKLDSVSLACGECGTQHCDQCNIAPERAWAAKYVGTEAVRTVVTKKN